ncbi:hypothetical protein F4825DRAFT_239166 [Nemania diffusa]|nr:hypothetical protein F4825DRAFT_239166 [Nemania diffusa]
MSDSIRDYRRSPSPRSSRKRPHEHDGADERRVRRCSDENGHRSSLHRRISRSPRPSDVSDYKRDHRHADSHARDDRNGTGHGKDVRHPSYDGKSPRQHNDTRSRSPTRRRHRHHGRDDTEPSRRHRSHHHRPRHAPTTSHQNPAPDLPCGAHSLSRSADLKSFRPLFARYLDIQKQIDIAALDEREVRGRWKSFVSKWNSGELAEGWYRPETFEDAMLDFQGAGDGLEDERRRDSTGRPPSSHELRHGSSTGQIRDTHTIKDETDDDADTRSQNLKEGDDEDSDEYGPTVPARNTVDSTTRAANSLSQTKHGPGIPTLTDLTLRREQAASDRDSALTLLRHHRAADRALQKERLDELAPRADAGTQARRLEKRRDARDANAAFANAKAVNDAPELADVELMGGADGGVEEHKKLRREAERKRTEREVRREEMMRAKREEREERAKEYREREASTVDMLREMARSRFG